MEPLAHTSERRKSVVSRKMIPGKPAYLPPPPCPVHEPHSNATPLAPSPLSSSFPSATATPTTVSSPTVPRDASIGSVGSGTAPVSPPFIFRERSLTHESGSALDTGRRFTRVIIKEGKKVEMEDPFNFNGLENIQTLALMDSFKVCMHAHMLVLIYGCIYIYMYVYIYIYVCMYVYVNK